MKRVCDAVYQTHRIMKNAKRELRFAFWFQIIFGFQSLSSLETPKSRPHGDAPQRLRTPDFIRLLPGSRPSVVALVAVVRSQLWKQVQSEAPHPYVERE